MDDNEPIEVTALVIRNCFVYKVPPRPAAGGYRASEWSDFIWQGKLKVITKGERCWVHLEGEDGNLFAVCPVNTNGPQAVEPVIDSSRYFVLRIEDGRGKHAFVGVAFNGREEAFDFNVALQDHAKYVRQMQEERERAARGETFLTPAESKDYSLAEGETIRINFKPSAKQPAKKAAGSKGDPAAVALPPPPSKGVTSWSAPSNQQPLFPSQGQKPQPPPSQNNDLLWSDFSSGSSSSNSSGNDWVTFS